MIQKCFFFFLLALGFHSCLVYNATNDVVQIKCEVHNTKLHKALVRTTYGLRYETDYNNAFPHAKARMSMGCLVPHWPVRRLALVYCCKSCTKAKRKWARSK